MKRILSLAAAAALSLLVPASAARTLAASGADTLSGAVFPLNILEDVGRFAIYVNEESLVRIDTKWLPGGAMTNEYAISLGGQTVSASMGIEVDSLGLWTKIAIASPRGDVTVVREGLTATVASQGQSRTVALKPGTVLFENNTPALMSQAVAAYDGERGGSQTIPVFIVPALLMDATLERLETAERFFGGRLETFTVYRYGLPGVDITIWADAAGRICLADVPAQRAAYVRDGYEILRLAPSEDSLLSKPEHDVEVERGVMIPMRDGVRLATDIYRPLGVERAPVILIRTPYARSMQELKARFYARRGYAFAVQDCRGRFDSEGTWNPFFDEPHDGYDTIEWLAERPWSSGKVGMIGGSYLGWVQWWAAREAPPHLAAIIPNVAPPDPWFNIPYEYGSFFLLGAIWWADVLEKEATADLSGKALSEIGDKNYAKLLRGLPVIDLDKKVLGKKNKYWREWIDHPANDAYWQRASFLSRLGGAAVPVYHQSGWFDGDGIGSKLNYLAMREAGHGGQKLVLGPWGHTDAATRMGPGERDFGPNATSISRRATCAGSTAGSRAIDNGVDREPLGRALRDEREPLDHGPRLPAPGNEIHPAASPEQRLGEHLEGKRLARLRRALPRGRAVRHVRLRSRRSDARSGLLHGRKRPRRRRAPATRRRPSRRRRSGSASLRYYRTIDETRRDILVYDTEPLTDSLVIAGPVSAVLYASSSAKDTDWFMRLSEIDEKGNVFPLVHGTIRARFRESFSKPKLLRPGEICEYRLDLWQTGIMIPRGRKLRVEVASAAFPTFSRNLNTGKHNEKSTKHVRAEQRIYHDAEHPSHVLLPVIERPELKDGPW